MSLYLRSAILVFSSIGCVGAGTDIQQALPDSSPVALWSTKAPKTVAGVPKSNEPDIRGIAAGVLFINSAYLAVYRVAFDPHQLSPRTPQDIASTYKLTISVFDTGTGKFVSSRSWGTREPDSSVHIVASGVLLQTGERLNLLTENLTDKQEVTLPGLARGTRRIVSVSPNGKTVLVNDYDRDRSHFVLLDGVTLKQLTSWDDRPPLRVLYSISEHKIAAADFDQQNIILADLGCNKWSVLGSKSKIGCVGSPTLINDVLLVNGCNVVEIVSTGGSASGIPETYGASGGKSKYTTL